MSSRSDGGSLSKSQENQLYGLLCALVILVFVFGFGMIIESQKPAPEIQVQYVEVTAVPPLVQHFESESSFVGGAGSYHVDCQSCQVAVANTDQCVAVSVLSFVTNRTQININIRVRHDEQESEDTSFVSDQGNGVWIVENVLFDTQTVGGYNVDYFEVNGQRQETPCASNARFSVFFSQGGTVTTVR